MSDDFFEIFLPDEVTLFSEHGVEASFRVRVCITNHYGVLRVSTDAAIGKDGEDKPPSECIKQFVQMMYPQDRLVELAAKHGPAPRSSTYGRYGDDRHQWASI